MIFWSFIAIYAVLGLGFILFPDDKLVFGIAMKLAALVYICSAVILEAVEKLETKLQDIEEK